MALKLEEKKVVVAEVNAVAAKALSVVGAENRGLTVTQMTDLRAKARKEGVYLRIVKNTLARKAVAGTAFECISPALKGPIVLAFSNEDPGAAARIFPLSWHSPTKIRAPPLESSRRLRRTMKS